jgi:hypothetical protein
MLLEGDLPKEILNQIDSPKGARVRVADGREGRAHSIFLGTTLYVTFKGYQPGERHLIGTLKFLDP